MFATAYNLFLLGRIAGDIVALPPGQGPSVETVAKVLGVSVGEVEAAVAQQRRLGGEGAPAGRAPTGSQAERGGAAMARALGKAPPSPGSDSYEAGRRAAARALGVSL